MPSSGVREPRHLPPKPQHMDFLPLGGGAGGAVCSPSPLPPRHAMGPLTPDLEPPPHQALTSAPSLHHSPCPSQRERDRKERGRRCGLYTGSDQPHRHSEPRGARRSGSAAPFHGAHRCRPACWSRLPHGCQRPHPVGPAPGGARAAPGPRRPHLRLQLCPSAPPERLLPGRPR